MCNACTAIDIARLTCRSRATLLTEQSSGIRTFYFEKIRVFKAGPEARIMLHGIME